MKNLLFVITLLSFSLSFSQKEEIKYFNQKEREVLETENWEFKVIKTIEKTSKIIKTIQETYTKEGKLVNKEVKIANKRNNSVSVITEKYHNEEGYKTVTKYVIDPKKEMIIKENCQTLDGKIILDSPCYGKADSSTFGSKGFREWIGWQLHKIADSQEGINCFVEFSVNPKREISIITIKSRTDEEIDYHTQKEIEKMIKSIPKEYLPEKLNTFIGEEIETTFGLPLILIN